MLTKVFLKDLFTGEILTVVTGEASLNTWENIVGIFEIVRTEAVF